MILESPKSRPWQDCSLSKEVRGGSALLPASGGSCWSWRSAGSDLRSHVHLGFSASPHPLSLEVVEFSTHLHLQSPFLLVSQSEFLAIVFPTGHPYLSPERTRCPLHAGMSRRPHSALSPARWQLRSLPTAPQTARKPTCTPHLESGGIHGRCLLASDHTTQSLRVIAAL